MLRNSRRSSLGGSSISLPTSSRRSSLNPKDIERIQTALRTKQQLSPCIILCLLILSPIMIFCFNYAILHYDGSALKLLSALSTGQLSFSSLLPLLPTNTTVWKVIAFVVLLQIIFSLVLPYDSIMITNCAGEREWRRINSFWSCLLIVLLYLMGSGLGFYNGSVIFVNWTELLSLLNFISIIIVLVVYMKCRLTEGTNSISDPLSDIFDGCELAPILFDIDIKHFITYRIAFTFYPLYIISSLYYCYATRAKIPDGLLACSALQLIYIAKTQWLEHLHFSRLDAQIDKAGFYRIWGVIVFLPILYSTPITVIATTGISLPSALCVLLFVICLIAIYISADIDIQRFSFRQANGHMKIWGKDPFFIVAKFKRDNGEVASNLLLGSGWWGLSRHLNYAVEIVIFACWSILPKSSAFLHYLPLIFIASFLWIRMTRDETRCLAKYGHHWIQYTNRVPFLIIPSLY